MNTYANRQMESEPRLDFNDPHIVGRVVFWRADYGFARDTKGEDYFIARRALPGRRNSVPIGTMLRFLAFQGRDQVKAQAFEIEILKP